MTTDNGNGTRVPDEGEFLHQVQGEMISLEALADALKRLLKDMPPPGQELGAAEMARAKTEMRRLLSLAGQLLEGINLLMQLIEADLRRREQPQGNT